MCVLQNTNTCRRLGTFKRSELPAQVFHSRGNAVSMATNQQPSISKANLLPSRTCNNLTRENIGVHVKNKGSVGFMLQFSCITTCFACKAPQLSCPKTHFTICDRSCNLGAQPAKRDMRTEVEKENEKSNLRSGD